MFLSERSRRAGRAALMVMVALVPVVVITRVMTTEGRDQTTHSEGKTAVAGADGRRLEETESFSFATQVEMTICLTEGHTADSATVTADQVKEAVGSVLNIENLDFLKVDDSVTVCTEDDWQQRASIYNTANDDQSAADIAADQVDTVYLNTEQFFTDLSAALLQQDSTVETESTDFDVESLGFLVVWLDTNGDVVSSQGTSKGKNVVTIGNADVWWPWWAWLIYVGVVVVVIIPLLFFFFKCRRDKEASEENFSGGKGSMETPAAPSATSTNAYGGQYATGEEYKNGQ